MIAPVDQGYRANQLTIEYYNKIRKKMRYLLYKKYGIVAIKEDLTNCSMGYLFEAALDYDENKMSNFVSFAIQRMIFRIIDYRKNLSRHVFDLKKEVEDAVKEIGSDEESDVLAFFKQQYDNDEQVEMRMCAWKFDFIVETDISSDVTDYKKNDIFLREYENFNDEEIEWEDTRDVLREKAIEYFDEDDINLKVLLENMIPEAEGREFKTKKDIAIELGVCPTSLSRTLRSGKLKDFVNRTKIFA